MPTPTMMAGPPPPQTTAAGPAQQTNSATSQPQPQPEPLGAQTEGLLAADLTSYATGFSDYEPYYTPADWEWVTRSSDSLWAPTIVYYGGGVSDEYKRLEFTDQATAAAESWLIKNDVYYAPMEQVEAYINFQTEDAGVAGVVVGWKDVDNFAAIMLDQVNDTVWILVYVDGVPSWENNGYGATTLLPYVDYRLIAFTPSPLERGMGYINVWLQAVELGGGQEYLFTSANPVDLRGRAGIGVVNGIPRVLFDWYWGEGATLPQPAVNWAEPVGDYGMWDVYGETLRLAASTINDIAIRFARFWRFNAELSQWENFAVFYGPPYELYINTGTLNFGVNDLYIELYTIDNRWIWGPYLTLNRLRVPESAAVLTSDPVLTADGQSSTQVVVELRDRGGNLLPQVPVTFAAQNVRVEQESVYTNGDGQAIVTVTAGTLAGAGKVTFQAEDLQGEVPVTLLPGAPSSLRLTASQTQLVADGSGKVNIVATLGDAFNNPIPNAALAFETTLGTVAGSSTTNQQGEASVQLVAGTSLGAAEITAHYSGLTAATTVQLVAGAPAALTILAAPVFLYADGASSGTVRVKLMDAYAHPLNGRIVRFSTTLGAIDTTAATNATGEAEAQLVASSALGTAQVQATLDSLSSVAVVEMVAGPAAVLQLNPAAREVVVADTDEVPIMLAVHDAYNRPLAGVTAWFSTTLGTITPLATTDSNGLATAVLKPNRAVGQALVTAVVEGVTTQVEIMLKASAVSLYLAIAIRDDLPPALVNGNFDAGINSGWVQLVDGRADKLIYHRQEKQVIPEPVSSPYVAWLGGSPSQIQQLYQSVTLPGNYPVAVEFMYYMQSGERDCGQDTAFLEVIVGGAAQPLRNIPLCYSQQVNGWRRGAVSLAGWRGQSVILQFRSSLNGKANSNLFLDNVRLCRSDAAAPVNLPFCSIQ